MKKHKLIIMAIILLLAITLSGCSFIIIEQKPTAIQSASDFNGTY